MSLCVRHVAPVITLPRILTASGKQGWGVVQSQWSMVMVVRSVDSVVYQFLNSQVRQGSYNDHVSVVTMLSMVDDRVQPVIYLSGAQKL